jgi:hypothetical protein
VHGPGSPLSARNEAGRPAPGAIHPHPLDPGSPECAADEDDGVFPSTAHSRIMGLIFARFLSITEPDPPAPRVDDRNPDVLAGRRNELRR